MVSLHAGAQEYIRAMSAISREEQRVSLERSMGCTLLLSRDTGVLRLAFCSGLRLTRKLVWVPGSRGGERSLHLRCSSDFGARRNGVQPCSSEHITVAFSRFLSHSRDGPAIPVTRFSRGWGFRYTQCSCLGYGAHGPHHSLAGVPFSARDWGLSLHPVFIMPRARGL